MLLINFVLSVQPVQPRDDPLNTLSLRTGRGSAPAHPHTDHHMSKKDGPSPNQLCVPITNTITIDQFTELVAIYDVMKWLLWHKPLLKDV